MSGYLYVLTHPSNPNLYKVGQTTRNPVERLAEHNCNCKEYAGRIVKETGQKWELKEDHAVPDPAWAEIVFWSATGLADIPFRGRIEVETITWEEVRKGLDAAKKAGVRPVSNQLPDHVYAYTVWMNKRLEGRGITLIGYVKSMVSGKATFRCSNGHEWRIGCNSVAEGEGCPECGIGNRTAEEIWQAAKLGYLCLLIHPDKPGFIKIGITYNRQPYERTAWEDWEVHRYRRVENPVLAERLIWDLLGSPIPNNREAIKIDLNVAEEAFRELIYKMYHEIALVEKEKEDIQKTY